MTWLLVLLLILAALPVLEVLRRAVDRAWQPPDEDLWINYQR